MLTTFSEVGHALAGLVAAEGSFVVTRVKQSHVNGDPRLRFVFQVTMARRDRPLLEALRAYLGVGSIHDAPRRRSHWLDQSVFTVNSRYANRKATVPFASAFLPECEKRRQFGLWVAAMDAYDAAHPSRYLEGPGRCSEHGCELPVRGRGLCRRHYYRATGY